MEGYSVTEAASVLGVPTERVWELLARGVLAGAPEGESGMRVFFQPRPAPAPPEPTKTNGNGGSREPEREMSPFRELLSEFRSLTERYGQALLALGEARGEVAALRSRVDLLEARMDLRLPPGGTTGWVEPAPTPVRPMPRSDSAGPPSAEAVEPEPAEPEPAAQEAAAPSAQDTETESRAPRSRSPRRATESFAEALARAEDPSTAELPGGREITAALSALRVTIPDDSPSSEATLPRELPPADEVPVADEPSAADEPASVADQVEPVPDQLEPVPTQAVPEQAAPEEPAPPEEPQPEGSAMAEAVVVEAAPDEAPPEESAPEAALDEPEAAVWQDERYTAEVAEPDWFEQEEFEATDPPPPPTPDAPAMGSERTILTGIRPETSSREETLLWFGGSPDADEAGEAAEPSEAVASTGDADDMEVAPTGRSSEPGPLPGSRELDNALAALEALSRSARPSAAKPSPDPEEQQAAGPRVSEEAPDPPPASSENRPASSAPARRAYRRLRRIFPG